jgi:hypothetical protein
LAAFADLVAVAAASGVGMGELPAHVARLLGADARGEVHDDEARAALIDALAGRWAAGSAADA